MTPSQRKTEDQYLRKEKRAIDTSQELLQIERERLKSEKAHLSTWLYKTIERDLMEMKKSIME